MCCVYLLGVNFNSVCRIFCVLVVMCLLKKVMSMWLLLKLCSVWGCWRWWCLVIFVVSVSCVCVWLWIGMMKLLLCLNMGCYGRYWCSSSLCLLCVFICGWCLWMVWGCVCWCCWKVVWNSMYWVMSLLCCSVVIWCCWWMCLYVVRWLGRFVWICCWVCCVWWCLGWWSMCCGMWFLGIVSLIWKWWLCSWLICCGLLCSCWCWNRWCLCVLGMKWLKLCGGWKGKCYVGDVGGWYVCCFVVVFLWLGGVLVCSCYEFLFICSGVWFCLLFKCMNLCNRCISFCELLLFILLNSLVCNFVIDGIRWVSSLMFVGVNSRCCWCCGSILCMINFFVLSCIVRLVVVDVLSVICCVSVIWLSFGFLYSICSIVYCMGVMFWFSFL